MSKEPVSPEVDILARFSIEEVLKAMRIKRNSWLWHMLEKGFVIPARRFGRVAVEYDRLVGEIGLRMATLRVQSHFICKLEVKGLENVPRDGALLLGSNHPGGADVVALLASIPRPDLKILAADRPLLRALPNTAGHLIYLPSKLQMRISAMRELITDLLNEQAVLMFPKGNWEPDPALFRQAESTVKMWSESIGFFLSKVPQTRFLPVAVKGVLSKKVFNHPLVHLVTDRSDRHNWAIIFQTIIQQLIKNAWPIDVQVVFGEAFLATQLSSSLNPRLISQAALQLAADLLQKESINGPLLLEK